MTRHCCLVSKGLFLRTNRNLPPFLVLEKQARTTQGMLMCFLQPPGKENWEGQDCDFQLTQLSLSSFPLTPATPAPQSNLDMTEGPVPANRLLLVLQARGEGQQTNEGRGREPARRPWYSSTVNRPKAFVLRATESSSYRPNRSWRRFVKTALRGAAENRKANPKARI